MLALMTSPLLVVAAGWDRAARGALLEELCGFGYMPSTLDPLQSRLKYVGYRILCGRYMHGLGSTKTAKWGKRARCGRTLCRLHEQPVWTDLFSQSSKVVGWQGDASAETVGLPFWLRRALGGW